MYLYFGHIMIEATLSDLTNETLRLICLSTLCVDFRYLWRLLFFCYLQALRQPELQPRGVTCAELSTVMVMVMVTNIRIDLESILD